MRRTRSGAALKRDPSGLFAALGDPTRLSLVEKLVGGESKSISELTEGTKLTRQAVTKHLRVLEGAGVVHSVKAGRENHFEFRPQPILELSAYLEKVAGQWDEALLRLKAFVES